VTGGDRCGIGALDKFSELLRFAKASR